MLREYICAYITKRRKRKFIMHFRCTVPNTTKGKIANILLKRLCSKCDGIILLNEVSVEYLKKITDVPLYLIPNFIEKNEIIEKKEIRASIETVLYIGGVTSEKGCDDIIEVAKAFPEIQFRLVGEPELYISQLAKNVPNVVLTGSKDQSEIKRELNQADVFMFLTHYYGEGFSNALAEAMAYGLPCIVSDWAANADMIKDQGGMVVHIKNIREIIHALEVMKSPLVREKYSKNNIMMVRKSYISDKIQSDYVDCYEEIAGLK